MKKQTTISKLILKLTVIMFNGKSCIFSRYMEIVFNDDELPAFSASPTPPPVSPLTPDEKYADSVENLCMHAEHCIFLFQQACREQY